MGLALTPDGMALLQFKDALTISPVLEGWNASDPCSWGGINCTAAGRVSEIVLTYQLPALEGHLSASLGELTSLEVLWLDGNLLSGSIPPEIGNLSSLTFLSLSFENFSGEVLLNSSIVGTSSNYGWTGTTSRVTLPQVLRGKIVIYTRHCDVQG